MPVEDSNGALSRAHSPSPPMAPTNCSLGRTHLGPISCARYLPLSLSLSLTLALALHLFTLKSSSSFLCLSFIFFDRSLPFSLFRF